MTKEKYFSEFEIHSMKTPQFMKVVDVSVYIQIHVKDDSCRRMYPEETKTFENFPSLSQLTRIILLMLILGIFTISGSTF